MQPKGSSLLLGIGVAALFLILSALSVAVVAASESTWEGIAMVGLVLGTGMLLGLLATRSDEHPDPDRQRERRG